MIKSGVIRVLQIIDIKLVELGPCALGVRSHARRFKSTSSAQSGSRVEYEECEDDVHKEEVGSSVKTVVMKKSTSKAVGPERSVFIYIGNVLYTTSDLNLTGFSKRHCTFQL